MSAESSTAAAVRRKSGGRCTSRVSSDLRSLRLPQRSSCRRRCSRCAPQSCRRARCGPPHGRGPPHAARGLFMEMLAKAKQALSTSAKRKGYGRIEDTELVRAIFHARARLRHGRHVTALAAAIFRARRRCIFAACAAAMPPPRRPRRRRARRRRSTQETDSSTSSCAPTAGTSTRSATTTLSILRCRPCARPSGHPCGAACAHAAHLASRRSDHEI